MLRWMRIERGSCLIPHWWLFWANGARTTGQPDAPDGPLHFTMTGSGGVWFCSLFVREFCCRLSSLILFVSSNKNAFFGMITLTVIWLPGFSRWSASICVRVLVHLYEYLFITSSAFHDNYGSYFPWCRQSKASVALKQTNKHNSSHTRLYIVFSCVKMSEEDFAGKWREKQHGVEGRLGFGWASAARKMRSKKVEEKCIFLRFLRRWQQKLIYLGPHFR